MKHIKLFEAEIRKSFMDWLKDPKAPSHESIYTFEFPVKKVYNINEGNGLDGDSLIDYLKYERGNDICQDIANELEPEYMGAGDFDEDEDFEGEKITRQEVEANFDNYFDQWIEQQFNNDTSKFFRMYDLDFEEHEINEEEFDAVMDSFNEEDLKQFYPYREFNQDFKILKMEITELKDGNIIVGKIETNRDLTNDEKESIKDYLEGQCSDGWGEGFSQNTEDEESYGLKFTTFISTWWNQGYPEWYLEVK